MGMISPAKFRGVSETLIGEPRLDSTLAAEYLKRLRAVPEAKALPRLAAELDAIAKAGGDSDAAIKERILGDEELRALVKVIVLLWYLGEIGGPNPYGGRPEHYFQGLFWKIVHAHPPALSGGYSGYWAYPPDN
jgi:Membrane bound FAD containing D-sorbitol dehydrogenase